MLKDFATLIRKNWLGILLIFISLFIVWKSHIPGTWLIGWDTLHPEFDFSLNLSKVLNGVWRSDQGLGTVAFHSHMSELPRIGMLWLLSLIFPVHLVRYVLISILFISGPLGVFAFFQRNQQASSKQIKSSWPAFLAGLFYLFNLGTLQHFYVVFDMFAFQYATIGWIFLVLSNYLRNGSKRWLFAFFILGFLSSPMAYAATLWYALFGGIVLYLLGLIISEKKRVLIKRAGIALAVLLIANAYWLMPNAYVLVSGASRIPTESTINSLFSQEAFLRNQTHGSIKDTLSLKNFLFDWQVFSFGENQFQFLMPEWITHVERWQNVGFVIGLLASGGLIYSLYKRKRSSIGIVFSGLLGFIMLANTTPPMAWLIQFLREHSNLFEEALRFPFTKFSILFMFSLAIGFGYFAQFIEEVLKKRSQIIKLSLFGLLTASLLAWCWPMLTGNVISKNIQQKVPQDYFELFSYMKTQPKGRVLVLPFNTQVGWEYFDWGFQGAGFVWFGMPQSVLVRDFDRWSEYNETLFNQLNYAIKNSDTAAFKTLLKQYNIYYILLDSSMIRPGNASREPFYQAEKILHAAGLDNLFSSENVIMHRRQEISDSSDVFIPKSAVAMQQMKSKNKQERVFSWYGDYFEGEHGDLIIPFNDIYQAKIDGITFDDQDQNNNVTFTRSLKTKSSSSTIKIPGLYDGSKYRTNATVIADQENVTITFESPVELKFDNSVVHPFVLDPIVMPFPISPETSIILKIENSVVRIEKGGEVTAQNILLTVGEQFEVTTYSTDSNDVSTKPGFELGDVQKCWTREGAEGVISSEHTTDALKLTVQDASACVSYEIESEGVNPGLLSLEVDHRSRDGAMPYFCVANKSNGDSCILDDAYGFEATSRDWATINRWIEVHSGDAFYLDLIGRPPKTLMDKWSIEYKKPNITFHKQIQHMVIPPSAWLKHQSEQLIQISQPFGTISITLPVNPVKVALDEGKVLKNCDIYVRGEVEKTLSETGGIVYSAQKNGSGCDEYNLEKLSSNIEYILRLTGENISGRGLKFYLYNFSSQSNDIEYILENGEFDSAFSVSAWPNIADDGYALNLENRSFGEDQSVNRLDSITFYPITVGWLSQIRLIPVSDRIFSISNNNFFVKKTSNWGNINFSSSIEIEKEIHSDSDKHNLIALTQGFDDGWLGYEVSSETCGTLCRLAPWWFGERLEHVKVNGWANGWLVASDGERGTGDDRRSTNDVTNASNIVLLFWPQYLEWGGLLLLASMGAGIGLAAMKMHKSKKK